MAPRTIGGMPLNLLASEPTTVELAGVIADMDQAQVADFFCDLAEQFRNKYGYRDTAAFEEIAAELHTLENKIHDGGGSRLLRELSSRLKETV